MAPVRAATNTKLASFEIFKMQEKICAKNYELMKILIVKIHGISFLSSWQFPGSENVQAGKSRGT